MFFQNLKYNGRARIFHLILVAIVSILIVTVKNIGVVGAEGGGGLLNEQNLLSVTKVPSKPVVLLLALGFVIVYTAN